MNRTTDHCHHSLRHACIYSMFGQSLVDLVNTPHRFVYIARSLGQETNRTKMLGHAIFWMIHILWVGKFALSLYEQQQGGALGWFCIFLLHPGCKLIVAAYLLAAPGKCFDINFN